MSTVDPAAGHTAPTELLQLLSRTPYACSSLSPPLSSRPGNIVYRGILARPIHAQDGTTAKSIIVKHYTDRVPKTFEELLLHSLTGFSLSSAIATIKTPRLYLYDRETNTQVMEDFSDTHGFKTMFFSVGVQNHLSLLSTSTIGHQLGFWLRSFHNWSLTPEQVALRAQVWQNDHMRELKYSFTYGSVLKALENFPELLKSHKETLDTIGDFLAKEDQRMSKEGGDGYSVLHGDFWSGNILIDNAGWREPPLLGRTNELFVIDWEFSHFGHRSCDLGQIVGDLYERKIYGNFDTAISIMKGVIDGYGTLSDEMAFRTAIYVGAHLITCYNRRPRKALNVTPPDVIVAGLTIGIDFMLKGWAKDRDFFRDSALASLFAAR